MRKLFLLSLLTLACAPGAAQAAPIYADGNECPTDAQVAAAGYARQYYVIPSERCVFDVDSNNLQGTTGEADTYLNSADATAAGWGTAAPEDDWTGLGPAGGDSHPDPAAGGARQARAPGRRPFAAVGARR